MKKISTTIFYLLMFSCFTACIRIPSQSVTLADALQTEGERMHNLNVAFLNSIFIAKKKAVDRFITEVYTPAIVNNYTRLVDSVAPNYDYKANFQKLMQAIQPQIDARRDSLSNALEMQKGKLLDKMNADYKLFDNAATDLKNLLASATKLDREKQLLMDKAKALSNERVDFNKLETIIDKFISSAGSAGEKISTLNDDINQLIKK